MTAPPEPELVAEGLSYPTSLAFDDKGSPWIAEAGLPLEGRRREDGYGGWRRMVSVSW